MRSIPLDLQCFELRGALEIQRTEAGLRPRRLPTWTLPQVSDPLMSLVAPMGSGVRLVLATDSEAVELDVLLTTLRFLGNPVKPLRFDLLVDGAEAATHEAEEARVLLMDRSDRSTAVTREGAVTTIRFDGLRGRAGAGRGTGGFPRTPSSSFGQSASTKARRSSAHPPRPGRAGSTTGARSATAWRPIARSVSGPSSHRGFSAGS